MVSVTQHQVLPLSLTGSREDPVILARMIINSRDFFG
jgi:hypothetical protein